MIHRLPASRHALVCAVLLAVNVLHASQDSVLIPGQFFLADRFLNDSGYRLETNYLIGGLSASLQMRDLALTHAPLSYAGSIQKPFDGEQPFVESHTLSLRFPGRESRVAAGISLGVDIGALSYDMEESAWGWNGGSDRYAQFYLRERHERVRTARLHYSGTGNLLFRDPYGFAVVSLQGNIVQHSGYAYVETRDDNGETRLELRDYEPGELAYGYTAGVLVARRLGVGRNLYNWVLGIDYMSQEDRLRSQQSADAIPANDENQSLTISDGGYGSWHDETVGWIGLRPRSPRNLNKSNMAIRGRFAHGLMMREVSLRLARAWTRWTDMSFAFDNTLQPPVLGVVEYVTQLNSISLFLEPELFITTMASLSIQISGIKESKVFNPGTLLGITSQRDCLSLAGAAVVRAYVPITSTMRLEISAHSGEVCAVRESATEASPVEELGLYRAYNAGIGLSLSGTY